MVVENPTIERRVQGWNIIINNKNSIRNWEATLEKHECHGSTHYGRPLTLNQWLSHKYNYFSKFYESNLSIDGNKTLEKSKFLLKSHWEI